MITTSLQRLRRIAPRRRGGTIVATVAGTATFGALVGAAIIVTPARSVGGSRPEPTRAIQASHQMVHDGVEELVARAVEIIAIHVDNGRTDVVLWLEDRIQPGTVNRGEVAVLSHSRVMQHLVVHLPDVTASDNPPDLVAAPIDRASLRRPEFCADWRVSPDIHPNVLAREVARFEIEPLGAAVAGPAPVRIALTWPVDSTDGADVTAAIVDAVVRPTGDQE